MMYIQKKSMETWIGENKLRKGVFVKFGFTRRYVFFNRIVESEIVLPELIEAVDAGDDTVDPDFSFCVSDGQFESMQKMQWIHRWLAPDQSITLCFGRDEDAFYLYFPHMACFTVSKTGHVITCSARSSLAVATIRHLLLDQVLPRLFAHFHVLTVLHGSFLRVNGAGAGFLADSGWGKSTLAAAMAVAGNTVLTDDCFAIEVHDGRVTGIPAYPGMRLMPDSVDTFGAQLDCPGEPVAEYTQKQRIPLHASSIDCIEPFRVKALFLLTPPEDGEGCKEPHIDRAGGAGAMKELLKNSFCLDVNDGQWQQEHFKRIATLLGSDLPVYTLCYRRDYDHLPEVVNRIIDTVTQSHLEGME